MATTVSEAAFTDDQQPHPVFDIVQHGHKDVVQAVAFNAYGDRCATGSVDGKIRVFNRHKDGIWRLCDNWAAHGGDILELQWLPPTVYPNLLASLGIEGHFKLWAEDPAAAPGRRFSSRAAGAKAAFESRSGRHPCRSFSIRHNEETRYTHFALLSSDGHLSVHESEEPETVADYTKIDDFQAFPKPNRGEETCFKVQFDPNPEPCYAALRAGVPTDALGLVVSGMHSVKIFRTRDTVTSSFGAATRAREFYLAVEIGGHPRLVRDVAWAPGSYRGYDMIATACHDGCVRVFRVDTPFSKADGKTWSVADVTGAARADAKSGSHSNGHSSTGAGSGAGASNSNSNSNGDGAHSNNSNGSSGSNNNNNNNTITSANNGAAAHDGEEEGHSSLAPPGRQSGHSHQRSHSHTRSHSQAHHHNHHHHHHSGIRAELDKSGTHGERTSTGQPGQVAHRASELSRLDAHRSPVWRVGFDDDGQILGSVGDEGRLVCYRQTPDGSWAKSSELGMMKTKMAVP